MVARPCEVLNIRFEFKENRYYFGDFCPFHFIDKVRREDKEKSEKKAHEFLEEVAGNKLLPKEAKDAFGEDFNINDEIPF